MKKYLSILFVSLALLLVSPYYVFADENNQEQQQIVLAAPTLESGMGDQDTAYLTIILEGAYASGTMDMNYIKRHQKEMN